jgi:hypothetical protein
LPNKLSVIDKKSGRLSYEAFRDAELIQIRFEFDCYTSTVESTATHHQLFYKTDYNSDVNSTA